MSLDIVVKIVLSILKTSIKHSLNLFDTIKDWKVTSIQSLTRSNQMSKLDIRVTLDDSSNILIVIVEVSKSNMPLVKVPSVLIFGVLRRPSI